MIFIAIENFAYKNIGIKFNNGLGWISGVHFVYLTSINEHRKYISILSDFCINFLLYVITTFAVALCSSLSLSSSGYRPFI